MRPFPFLLGGVYAALILAAAPALAGEARASREPAATVKPTAEPAGAPSVGFDDQVDESMYFLRPGDRIKISVYQEPDLSGQMVVNQQGKINYPLLGEIYADGLSIEELREYIAKRLSADYVVNPQVQIDLESSPDKSISILGNVSKPGNYILTPNLTLVRLISEVGGFTTTAAVDRVKIVRTDKRYGKISFDVDVSEIMKGNKEDIRLQPSDMIFVDKMDSVTNIVSVLGQVAKPGNYPITPDLTLVRLISEAGGFTAIANPSNVKIVRKDASGKETTIKVDARRIIDGTTGDFPLEPWDLIVVGESMF
jgi:polysaccharide export outer membrane protein